MEFIKKKTWFDKMDRFHILKLTQKYKIQTKCIICGKIYSSYSGYMLCYDCSNSKSKKISLKLKRILEKRLQECKN